MERHLIANSDFFQLYGTWNNNEATHAPALCFVALGTSVSLVSLNDNNKCYKENIKVRQS